MTPSVERFIAPQAAIYDQVVAELKRGRKETHWIWFIFPQLKGLGTSATAQHFGISGADEARAYLRHPVLGSRLRDCTSLVNAIEGRSVDAIFGYPDNLKFRSCMTLFSSIATDGALFEAALEKYFQGKPDDATIQLLGTENPLRQAFEAAAEAVISGDIDTLTELLDEHPELVRMRSIREHRSTLLHYVSANGIEDRRQKTPQNILDIANLLLDAGADVNAESDAYEGHSTTLMLAATSCHPENAGLQVPLLKLLLARGARLDVPGGSIVNACLHNGRGAAAAFLAERGAALDIEGAAGVGRLDLIRNYLTPEHDITPAQLYDAFAWACQFGRTPVVAYLLEHGVPVDATLRHHGQTGLHWSAHSGHPETVRLLLENGAPVDRRDTSFAGTPLEWALHAWASDAWANTLRRKAWPEVVAQLVRAGGKFDASWFEADSNGGRPAEKLRSDPAMQAALKGETCPT